MKPLCFVLMPFGVKPTVSGRTIDFDRVYTELLRPAIERSGMEPIRADEEVVGGIVHKPMFERLLLCDYAVADLTTANANVFYELGVRHAVRRHTTVLVFAAGERLPFDLAPDRGLNYELAADGTPVPSPAFVDALASTLEAKREQDVDSPIYQLLGEWPDLPHSKTDVFRERVREDSDLKEALARARDQPSDAETVAACRQIEERIDVTTADAAVLVDLLLSYRAGSGWEDMVRLVGAMPAPLSNQTLVREQLGMALNRAGRSDEAERTLTELIEQRGASPETCGLLGRVYKDQYRAALAAGRTIPAVGYRKRAIEAYLRGFEADWRDAYPGINAIQLIHEQDPDDPRLDELIAVVSYAVHRKMASGKADYWDHATLLELAVLDGDQDAAIDALTDARAATSEQWMFDTTADTLAAIADRTGSSWIGELDAELRRPVR